jgi:hypothetical protein
VFFSGDVFEAIPFAGQPTMVVADAAEEPARHYLGDVAFAYGLLVSPTCDMYDQLAAEPRPAHPYRVLVPILPLDAVAEAAEAVERSVGSCARALRVDVDRERLPIAERGEEDVRADEQPPSAYDVAR